MTDWDLLTPGIGLTSIGIVGVGISLAGVAKTFIDGMHAVSLLTMLIGMIFLASGLFKDGFPSSGRAKSATFITLGFLVTFGVAAAVTVSTQVPSIFAYIGLMLVISIPAAVLAVASFKRIPYLKPIAIIFISGSIVAGVTFYAFGLVAPRPPVPEEEEEVETPVEEEAPPANVVNATILAGASAQGNPDYGPDQLRVNRGDGISWLNEDNAPHTVTSREEGLFDSSTILPGDSWLLNTADLSERDYEYFCTLHPHMVATLTILPAEGEVAGPAPASNETGQQEQAGEQPTVNQTGPSGPVGGTVTTVSIVVGASVPTNNEFFVPETVQTTVGSMVTWTNEDTAPHTATSGVVENNVPKPDGAFDSGLLNKGQSFSFVFDSPGEFDYYCLVHPYMTGKITVN
ncbi:MAG: plastocyanin/azurin family copper-binding protein [Nitrososphaera sp.]|nr:plastocyanin/azurin family copper-binding protein [Nitrososphaera sp.]